MLKSLLKLSSVEFHGLKEHAKLNKLNVLAIFLFVAHSQKWISNLKEILIFYNPGTALNTH